MRLSVRRVLALAALPVGLGVAGCGPAPGTCNGKAATLSGTYMTDIDLDAANGDQPGWFYFDTPGNDVIVGHPEPDIVHGWQGGHDTICTLGGHDEVDVLGGELDFVELGLGNDAFFGGHANVFGDGGSDMIRSAVGNVNGGPSDDLILDVGGNVLGGDGNDRIYAGAEVRPAVTLDGGAGNDFITDVADSPEDYRDSSEWHVYPDGGSDEDRLIGGAGADTLDSRDGWSDSLSGGTETDTCYASSGDTRQSCP